VRTYYWVEKILNASVASKNAWAIY